MFSLKALEARVQSFSVLCIPTEGTHIPSDMCAGIHISQGYTYHGGTHITGIHISRGYTYHLDTGLPSLSSTENTGEFLLNEIFCQFSRQMQPDFYTRSWINCNINRSEFSKRLREPISRRATPVLLH